MQRAIVLSLITIAVLSNYGQAQDFNTLTSRIFFDLDLSKNDTTLIARLESKPELVPKPKSEWTAYPPTDVRGNPIPFSIYIFFKHPYLSLSFADGAVIVLTDNESKIITGLVLSLSFNSKTDFDSTYKSLKESYTKYSSKSIRRPGMAWPFEVTKFLSKDNNYVIITKSQDGNKYYLNLAYNYQGYEW